MNSSKKVVGYFSLCRYSVTASTDDNEHICTPDPDLLLEHLAKQKFKLLAANLDFTANEAYKLVLEELQLKYPQVVPRFGSFQSLSSMGHRSNAKHTPPIYRNPADQIIEGDYAKTQDGKRFLLYYGVKGEPPDRGENDKRLVIALFSTKNLSLHALNQSTYALMEHSRCVHGPSISCTLFMHTWETSAYL